MHVATYMGLSVWRNGNGDMLWESSILNILAMHGGAIMMLSLYQMVTFRILDNPSTSQIILHYFIHRQQNMGAGAPLV